MKKIQEAQATQETREGNLLIQQNGELKKQEESTIKNQETTVKKQEEMEQKQENSVIHIVCRRVKRGGTETKKSRKEAINGEKSRENDEKQEEETKKLSKMQKELDEIIKKLREAEIPVPQSDDSSSHPYDSILADIQNELKVGKPSFNKYGGYAYRTYEDICNAIKPVLKRYGAGLTLNDDIVLIGERYYVKATARLSVGGEVISEVSSYARENADKKGMDASQLTGACSSYARKYALNGMFLLDDVRDADAEGGMHAGRDGEPRLAHACLYSEDRGGCKPGAGGQQGVCAHEPSAPQVGRVAYPEGGVASDGVIYASGTLANPGEGVASDKLLCGRAVRTPGTPPTPSGRGTEGEGSKRGTNGGEAPKGTEGEGAKRGNSPYPLKEGDRRGGVNAVTEANIDSYLGKTHTVNELLRIWLDNKSLQKEPWFQQKMTARKKELHANQENS